MGVSTKFFAWLRWIISFPVAIVVSYSFHAFITMMFVLVGSDTKNVLISNSIDSTLIILMSVSVFVWVGALIAPRNNYKSSCIFSIVWLFVPFFEVIANFILPATERTSWIDMLITTIAGSVGAAVIILYFRKRIQNSPVGAISNRI